MAKGFATKTSKENTGYKTLFERVNEATKGEKKSLSWYRSAVKSEASKYNTNLEKYIIDERKDRGGLAK